MKRFGPPMKARIDKRLTEKGARKRFEIADQLADEVPAFPAPLYVFELPTADRPRGWIAKNGTSITRELADAYISASAVLAQRHAEALGYGAHGYPRKLDEYEARVWREVHDYYDKCSTCGGSGGGTEGPIACRDCGGTGREVTNHGRVLRRARRAGRRRSPTSTR